MGQDLAALQADTPHCGDQTFLDNAGAALSPQIVTSTVIDYLQREQEVGGYVAADERAADFATVMDRIAALVNIAPQNIALQTSATAAWSRAISAVPFQDGDRVLITSAEYASNILPILQIRRVVDLAIEVIPDGSDGAADPSALADMLDENVRAVAVTHAPSQNGLLVNVQDIANVLAASEHRPWFLLDACQSIGQIGVDVSALGADFTTATGRKWLRGPRGTGFLAVSNRVLGELEPHPIDMFGCYWDGGVNYTAAPTAERFQSFETSYAGVLGLGAAIQYALDIGIDWMRARINHLANYLRCGLADIPGVRVVDRGTDKSGIVVFSLPSGDPAAITAELLTQRITVTPIGPRTNPTDIARNPTDCALRASPHVYNDETDLDILIGAIRELTRFAG